MRLVAIVALFLVAGSPWAVPPADAATCGEPGYPDADDFTAASVVDESLWAAFVSTGGFAGAAQGTDRVEVDVSSGGRNFTVTLTEATVREYVGGGATNVTVLQLEVLVEEGASRMRLRFTPITVAGRTGGNLTLLARATGSELDVYWRWAYLPCDEAFPNAYYVFHAGADGATPTDDNTLVYFEAPRPRRGPPLDLILLVVAGIGVTSIFLYARHTLKRKP
jgi:hypothetical protein